MTPTRALGAVAAVAVAVQVATLWSGALAVMAVGLLVAAMGEGARR